MRRLVLAAVAVSLLVPASAAAKFSAARICGPSDCRTITFHDGDTLAGMEKPIVLRADRGGAPSAPGPWYRLTLCPQRCGGSDDVTARVFPKGAYVQLVGHPGAYGLDDEALNAYSTATSGIAPYDPPAATGGAPGDSGGLPGWAWAAIAAGGVAVVAAAILLVMRRRRAQVPERSSSRAATS